MPTHPNDLFRSVADDTFERLHQPPDHPDDRAALAIEWERIVQDRPLLRGFIERLAHDVAPDPDDAFQRGRVASALVTLTLALDESTLMHDFEANLRASEPTSDV